MLDCDPVSWRRRFWRAVLQYLVALWCLLEKRAGQERTRQPQEVLAPTCAPLAVIAQSACGHQPQLNPNWYYQQTPPALDLWRMNFLLGSMQFSFAWWIYCWGRFQHVMPCYPRTSSALRSLSPCARYWWHSWYDLWAQIELLVLASASLASFDSIYLR